MRRALAGIAAASLAWACASQPAGTGFARVEVEMLRGFSPEEVALDEPSAPVVMIVDATQSMSARAAHASSRYEVAQRAALRFARAAPPGRPLWLYAMGARQARDASCQPLARGSRSAGGAPRAVLLGQLQELAPGGESGLAYALNAVRNDLAQAGTLAGSRIVVFSDLGRECGGELCRTAAGLVREGVRLDVVAIGGGQAPACLMDPKGPIALEPPPPLELAPVHYHLEVHRGDPITVGCSDAGGLPVAISPGRATVVVDLDPPLRVEAYFAPGRRHVLQVVDFPLLDPPQRQWRWLDANTPASETPR